MAKNQRADVNNPENEDYQTNLDHRSRQLNPEDEKFGGNLED